jgi:hypothetical protein
MENLRQRQSTPAFQNLITNLLDCNSGFVTLAQARQWEQ